MDLHKKYPEVWKAIENKEISQKDINVYLIRFLLDIIKEIKEGKRNELDVGDLFGIGIQHALGSYDLNPEVEDFFIELGDYKIVSGELKLDNVEKVEELARKLLVKLQK